MASTIATKRKRSTAITFQLMCLVAFVVGPIALVVWLPLSWHNLIRDDVFSGNPIGGNLSLTEAKAIDFISSAFLAPLVFFLLNWTWFTNARVALGSENKRRGKGVSLSAFVEASQTSSGTYDFLKMKVLLSSKSGQMVGMAAMILFSAIGQSTLSNIIAYEAFTQPGGQSQQTTLRLLVDPVLNAATFNPSIDGIDIPGFNSTQIIDVSEPAIDTLTYVALQNATTNLTAGAYVSPNVTSDQLNNFNTSIQELQKVPAIQGTINCEAYQPKSIEIAVSNALTINAIYIDDNSPNLTASPYTGPGYLSEFPATSESIDDLAPNDYIDYMAFNSDSTEVFFGVLGSNSSSGSSTNSPFGTISATKYQISLIGMSADSSAPTAYTAHTWGMKCRVSQTDGTLTLSRSANSASSPWKQSDFSFDSSTSEIRSAVLSAYAITDSGFQQTLQTNWTTLGAVIANTAMTCNYQSDVVNNTDFCGNTTATDTLNWQLVANNILYSSMETQRITYEAATSTDPSGAKLPADAFATVSARTDAIRYQITYIPALLLVGLICVMIVASLALGMMLYARNSLSGKEFRVVNGLRLVVDAVAGLRAEGGLEWKELASRNGQALGKWADEYMVRYEVENRGEWSLSKGAGRNGSIVLRALDKEEVLASEDRLPLTDARMRGGRTRLKQHDSDEET